MFALAASALPRFIPYPLSPFIVIIRADFNSKYSKFVI